MHCNLKTVACMVSLSLTVGACAAGSPDGPDLTADERARGLVAKIRLDGLRVDFIENEDELLMAAFAKEGVNNPVTEFEHRGMTYLQIYEVLVGEPAPQELVEAAERAGIETSPYVEESGDGLGTHVAALTSQEFLDMDFCRFEDVCRLNQTSNLEMRIGDRSSGMGGWFHLMPQSNSQVNITFRRRQRFDRYEDYQSWFANPGDTGFISTRTRSVNRKWKISVRNVDGTDKYHFGMSSGPRAWPYGS